MTDFKKLTLRLTQEQYERLQRDHIAHMTKTGEVIPLTHYIIKQLGI